MAQDQTNERAGLSALSPSQKRSVCKKEIRTGGRRGFPVPPPNGSGGGTGRGAACRHVGISQDFASARVLFSGSAPRRWTAPNRGGEMEPLLFSLSRTRFLKNLLLLCLTLLAIRINQNLRPKRTESNQGHFKVNEKLD